MSGRLLFGLWLVLLISGASAQKRAAPADAAGTNPKAELLAAFKKLKTVTKIRLTSVVDVNGLMTENSVLEYVGPDKYHRVTKKTRNGETFVNLETIQIAGRSFEKRDDRWLVEPKPFILLKDELKTALEPLIEGKTKTLGIKSTLTEVRFDGEEKSDDKTFYVYRYRIDDELGTSRGRLWVSAASGLPGKLENEARFGRNKITLGIVYEYDAEIVIEKPKIAG